MIEIESLSKRYPNNGKFVEALSGISLRVDQGCAQEVIGFSGAGKSTLLRCICVLEKPDEGRILIDGPDLAHLDGADLRAARRKLA